MLSPHTQNQFNDAAMIDLKVIHHHQLTYGATTSLALRNAPELRCKEKAFGSQVIQFSLKQIPYFVLYRVIQLEVNLIPQVPKYSTKLHYQSYTLLHNQMVLKQHSHR